MRYYHIAAMTDSYRATLEKNWFDEASEEQPLITEKPMNAWKRQITADEAAAMLQDETRVFPADHMEYLLSIVDANPQRVVLKSQVYSSGNASTAELWEIIKIQEGMDDEVCSDVLGNALKSAIPSDDTLRNHREKVIKSRVREEEAAAEELIREAEKVAANEKSIADLAAANEKATRKRIRDEEAASEAARKQANRRSQTLRPADIQEKPQKASTCSMM